MTDPTIICTNCKTEIRLTESLAALLIAATRREFERQLAQQNDEIAKREWAKREEQIGRVMGATVGMYGDLQGIAGKSLQEIEGLEFSALDAPDENEGNTTGL